MYVNDSHRRAVIRASWPDELLTDRKTPPSWVLDRAADLKLTGGLTRKQIKRQGVCPTCFQVRSVTMVCGCP